MSRAKKTQGLTARRARTHDRVLAAAGAVIDERGFQRSSLDEIAARAGLTKGAIYSNFESKEELFLAVISARDLNLKVDLPQAGTARDRLRAVGEACAALIPQARAQAGFIADYLLYALTHDEMRRHVEARHMESFRASAAVMAERFPKARLALPGDQLNVALQALSLGFALQSLLTPQAITRELVVATFEALAQPPAPN